MNDGPKTCEVHGTAALCASYGLLTLPAHGNIFRIEARARIALFPRPALRRGLSCFWGPEGDILRLSRRIRPYWPLCQSGGPQIQGEPGVGMDTSAGLDLGCGMAIFLFLPGKSRRCDWLITKEG